jgi:hypothetical protein
MTGSWGGTHPTKDFERDGSGGLADQTGRLQAVSDHGQRA